MIRTYVAFALAALFFAVSAVFGWKVAAQSRALRQQQAALAETRAREAVLQERLDGLVQKFAEQRALLRDESLASTVRTPDEFLALFPARFPQGDWRPANVTFEDCWFRSDDGLRLHGWYLRRPQPRAAVLMLHGNAGNLTHRAAAAQLWSRRYNVSFLVFDYRGYGRSEGTPTVSGLLHDARAARRELAAREAIAAADVVLFGESLGGAVAVDLAATDGARGLVLHSTFSSLREVARTHYPPLLVELLVADRLNSAEKIKDYQGPLLVCHGEADRTIPFELGRKLFAAANEPKQFLALPGHDHNDPLPEEFYRAADQFFAELDER